MGIEPNLWETTMITRNCIKGYVFQLSYGIKNICRRKLYQRYTHLKKTFAAATFKGLRDVSFLTFLWISRDEKTKQIFFIGRKFSFAHVDI